MSSKKPWAREGTVKNRHPARPVLDQVRGRMEGRLTQQQELLQRSSFQRQVFLPGTCDSRSKPHLTHTRGRATDLGHRLASETSTSSHQSGVGSTFYLV